MRHIKRSKIVLSSHINGLKIIFYRYLYESLPNFQVLDEIPLKIYPETDISINTSKRYLSVEKLYPPKSRLLSRGDRKPYTPLFSRFHSLSLSPSNTRVPGSNVNAPSPRNNSTPKTPPTSLPSLSSPPMHVF